MSVIVASDGTAPAPATVTLTWPADTSTPWAGPLFLLGGLFLVAGVVLYVLGIRHARALPGSASEGSAAAAKTEPIELPAGPEGEDKGVIAATPSRRSLSARAPCSRPPSSSWPRRSR